MKIQKLLSIAVVLSLVMVSCGNPEPSALPTPQIRRTAAPDVESVVAAYLDAWSREDYAAMYDLLSTASRSGISQADFSAIYEGIAINMTLQSLDAQLISASTNPSSANAKFSVTFDTGVFGTFSREVDMPLVMEGSGWGVVWDQGLIMPELGGGNRLVLESVRSERGAIFDRDGGTIVDQANAYALGIIPNQIGDGQEGTLLNQLSDLTGRTFQSIQESYEDIRLTNWYVPVGEASEAEVNEKWNIIGGLGGLMLTPFSTRYYYEGGIAPQAIGYVLPISEEEVREYQKQGYLGDELVGQAGLERFADDFLAGRPAASLYVVNPDGQIVTRINQADPQPPRDVTTTFNRNLQIESQQALLGFRGAVVVMEVDTGRILAMASSPGFDPNLFSPENRNSIELLDDVLNDGNQRLLNRVSQGTYPLGSIFKIIDMAAALESGLYTPDTTYYCGHYFEELPGERFEDWTLEKELPPSGTLTLVQGLTRSCNPWFYHIGLDLFRKMGATYLSDFARSFGLGSATGIGQVAEDEGQIVDPTTDGGAVQQGIGQGDMLVTPLQVVRFTAALANGGTLYRPQIIERVTDENGGVSESFTPEAQGTLPISQETLDAIWTGMRGVIRSDIGTARLQLRDLNIPMYGKTGTAQNPLGDSHAWFTGFTDLNREDLPDIAVTVIVENGGEGSENAAPVFRRVVETYYFGSPQKLYPWEAEFNVTRTPTPLYTETPVLEPGEAPPPSIPEQRQITPTPS